MNKNQDTNRSNNPVAISRAAIKARLGDDVAYQWLHQQHLAGNQSASKSLRELDRQARTS